MRKTHLLCLLLLGVMPVFSQTQTNVTYTSFNGTVYNMRAFFSKYTVTLIPEDQMVGLDTNMVRQLATITDSSYQYGILVTGKMPPLYRHINGKATIVYVAETCGAIQ